MDYKRLFAQDWEEIGEIGNHLIEINRIMEEQKELDRNKEKIDKELIAEQLQTFFDDISDLVEIKNELRRL